MEKRGRIIARTIGGLIIAGGVTFYGSACYKSDDYSKKVELTQEQLDQEYAKIMASADFVEERDGKHAKYLEQYETGTINVDEFTQRINYCNSREFVDDYLLSNSDLVEEERLIKQLTADVKRYEGYQSAAFAGGYLGMFAGACIGAVPIAISIKEESDQQDNGLEQ